jgi:hypothetical protein
MLQNKLNSEPGCPAHNLRTLILMTPGRLEFGELVRVCDIERASEKPNLDIPAYN